jgi:hypothetical protein
LLHSGYTVGYIVGTWRKDSEKGAEAATVAGVLPRLPSKRAV